MAHSRGHGMDLPWPRHGGYAMVMDDRAMVIRGCAMDSNYGQGLLLGHFLQWLGVTRASNPNVPLRSSALMWLNIAI